MFTLLEPYLDRLQIAKCTKAHPTDLHEWAVEHDCPIYQMQQEHGNTVLCITPDTKNYQLADAVCTNQTNVALSVRYADCQNFVLYDPTTHTLACVHAGYKGLVCKVLTACIQTLQKEYGVNPGDLLVASDASLCKQCAEFTDPVTELPGIDERFFNERLVDLVGIAKQELLDNGIAEEHIELSDQCTKCSCDEWFSYRGEEAVKTDSALRNVMIARLLPVT